MSPELGPVTLGESGEPIFLGRDMSRIRNYSEHTAQVIDTEIRRFIDDAYVRAMDILNAHRDLLGRMTELLLEQETLTSEEINALINRVENGGGDSAPAGEGSEGSTDGPPEDRAGDPDDPGRDRGGS
jgi:cell division protease FtsH